LTTDKLRTGKVSTGKVSSAKQPPRQPKKIGAIRDHNYQVI